MKKIVMAFVIILWLGNCTWAQEQGFKISEIFPIESSHSYVGFSIKYMGYAMVRGRFSNFQGTVRYNANDPTKTSVSFRILVGSIDTGDEWRDKDLLSDNWFNGKTYPTILFTSKNATVTPQGLVISGDLTIRETTKTISFTMAYPPHVLKDIRGDSQIIFTGMLTLNRIEFGVEGKKWAGIKEGITAVSDEVNIELSILAKRINAQNFRNWVADETSPHGKIYRIAKDIGVKKALLEFESLRSSYNNKVDVETLNTAGMMLLKENRIEDAVAIFRQNIVSYPNVSLVYESYAEAVATQGNWSEALQYYKLAILKDPDNVNAQEIIRHIRN
jgi:polyisoprenoid-binding protein YceI